MDVDATEPHRVPFALEDLEEQAEAFWQRYPEAVADRDGFRFVADGAALWLPLVGPRAVVGERIGAFCERLADDADHGLATRHLVLLLRAGALALGAFCGDQLLQHKAVRKYVVRGRGRAQATHLKTRGKSRYGSRLRLQNWKALLGETSSRWAELAEEHGPFERVLYSAPVRVWSELYDSEPPPPWPRGDARLVRIPLHVHRPDHRELLRVRAQLSRGMLELRR